MNTGQDSPSDTAILADTAPPSRQDLISALAKAEHRIAEEKSLHGETRFYFVMSMMLFGDYALFRDQQIFFSFFTCAIEVVSLLCLAERWGIERFIFWTDWMSRSIYEFRHGKTKD